MVARVVDADNDEWLDVAGFDQFVGSFMDFPGATGDE
jgi:hypothetical protein